MNVFQSLFVFNLILWAVVACTYIVIEGSENVHIDIDTDGSMIPVE